LNTQLTFKLNGQNISAAVEWEDIQVEATFINESASGGQIQSIQPNIDIERFTFVNDAAKLIRDYIQAGENGTGVGIFEGIPFEITANDGSNITCTFNGFLDLTDSYEEIHSSKVMSKVMDLSGLNSLSQRAQGVTYGFLLDAGVITSSDFTDIEYVMEKELQPLQLILTAVTIYLMTKELVEGVRKLFDDAANLVAHITGGITGGIAGVLLALAQVLIQAAYVAIMIAAIIKLVTELINSLISPIRKHKGINFRTLLEKGVGHLGLTLVSPNISELDLLFYLPSKPEEDTPISEGIPRPDDFGYTVDEALDLAQRSFNAKIQVETDGITLQLRSLNDPFWDQSSTHQMADILLESKIFNTGEFSASRSIEFLTDVKDEHTSNNYKGTNFVITTRPKTVNDDRMVMMTGFDRTQILVALPNRKDKLSDIEKALVVVAGAADEIIRAFGGSSNLASKIKGKVGMLKVAENIHTVPKLVPLRNGRMPSNHRALWSAKILETKYHNERSFVRNNFGQQHQLFRDQEVPFGLEEFLQLIQNSFFTTFDGRQGKADSIKWNMGRDKAFMDFRIKEIYTRNLQETFTEPE